MSWSLQLTNGDLVVNHTSFAAVTGADKLRQDLRCVILERMGTDNMHLGFGSLIDGGQTLTGYNPGVIGTVNDSLAATFVRSELARICSDYQTGQLARARSDQDSYGKATLSPDEVLLRLDQIVIQQVADTMSVTLFLTTGVGTPTTIDLTF